MTNPWKHDAQVRAAEEFRTQQEAIAKALATGDADAIGVAVDALTRAARVAVANGVLDDAMATLKAGAK